jgi:DHA2 family multidrug resistance protein-like MFS transporter
MGVAVLGLVATAVYRAGVAVPAGVPDGAARDARESISGAVLAAQRFPGQAGGELLASAREAFTAGLHVTAVVTAVVFLALAAVALAGLRRVPPTGAAQAGGPQEAGPSPAAEAGRTGAGTPGETGGGRPEGAGASGPAQAPGGAGEMSVR